MSIEPCNNYFNLVIVDDYLFNLIPLELLLKEKFNIKADMAMNGQEAADMFRKNLYK